MSEDKVTEKVISMALDIAHFDEDATVQLIESILAEDGSEKKDEVQIPSEVNFYCVQAWTKGNSSFYSAGNNGESCKSWVERKGFKPGVLYDVHNCGCEKSVKFSLFLSLNLYLSLRDKEIADTNHLPHHPPQAFYGTYSWLILIVS